MREMMDHVSLLKHIFSQKGFLVKDIVQSNEIVAPGLLHDPVVKYKVVTSKKVFSVVIKTESILNNPEKRFRDAYILCGADSNDLKQFDYHCDFLGMKNMPQNEVCFYQNAPLLLKQHIPHIYGIVNIDCAAIIIMENLDGHHNMNKINSPSSWSLNDILLAVRDLAYLHHGLIFLRELKQKKGHTKETISFLKRFHQIISYGSGMKLNDIIQKNANLYIDHLSTYESILWDNSTVIHNDYNIRNICINKKRGKIVAYDWEFWCVDSPMMDVLDFLLGLSPDRINRDNIDRLLNEYSMAISTLTGCNNHNYTSDLFIMACKYAACRMNMYLLCYKVENFPYIKRMYNNLAKILSMYST